MYAPSNARVRSLVAVLAVVGVSFGAFLAVTPRASAITYVRGFISVDTTWGNTDNTYILTQHVTVLPGVTLTIRPGVNVRVDPGRSLFVEGRLVADATQANPIRWVGNNTVVLLPPTGVQFNVTGTGSVSWNTFDRFDRPLVIMDTPWPSLSFNTITTATIGIGVVRASPTVADNQINKVVIGIGLSESSAQILRNTINVAQTGIQASVNGDPFLANNLITNVSGGLGVGIYATAGVTPSLWANTVRGVQGVRGNNGASAGAPGTQGGFAVGILLDSAQGGSLTLNTVDQVYGGRGGDGMDNPGGIGGRGGNGGSAAGIVVGNTTTSTVLGNPITNIYGGRGGNGGGSPATVTGGDGGNGGGAAGIETVFASGSAEWSSNPINGVTGGVGGNGGDGSGPDGRGGTGGEASGLFVVNAANALASGNFVTNVRGGYGGNSTAIGFGNTRGGDGGAATGIGISGIPGAAGSPALATVEFNTAWTVVGGTGGRGANGGNGGNATGGFVVANADGWFNGTLLTWNHWLFPAGGAGGVGTRNGGNGGVATGSVLGYITVLSVGNSVNAAGGGNGGDALDGSDGGRGGDAYGTYAYTVYGWSSGDGIDWVTEGAPGSGPPAQAATSVGWIVGGDAAWPVTTMTIENGSVTNVGDLDLQIRDLTDATTINTPFGATKVTVAPTSRLTVKNFLDVYAWWPNGFTPVMGAQALVEDNGVSVWNVGMPMGLAQWLLVTDRVYMGSNVALENETRVTVSYLSSSFGNNPRKIPMDLSNAQDFILVDRDAPTSTAGPLPPYETTATFGVPYSATDGNGTGLGNISLYYRKNGVGGWTLSAKVPAGSFGIISFTSTGDGTYEFQTIADDRAGNVEPGPGNANETWTVVDTTRPTSHVNSLPPWTNTFTFMVTWAPDGGVTDIATYTVQFNRGVGWVNWLTNTPATSGTFTAASQGVYQFRSIATDRAGNVEVVSGNDTWTIVDTIAPEAGMVPLSMYQTSLTFLVQWSSGAPDVATFHVQSRDNGGAWTDWFAATSLRSATFVGVDGHTYEFRCTASDYAGNADPLPPTNDTWTIVDVTEPNSLVGALPRWSTAASIALAWGPAPGTNDIHRYTIQFTDNGGAWTDLPGYVDTPARSAMFTGTDGHTYAFRSIATDYAGNVEPASSTNDTWTTVDLTAPASSASLAGTAGLAGWYVSGVTVTLTSSDATSGVTTISYRIDFGAWLPYSAPFVVGTDGSHKVEYTATDRAGNVETAKSATFKVDVTAPSTAGSLLGTQGDNGFFTSTVSVTLTATDAASGVSAVSYRVDGGAWQTYAAPFTVTTDGVHTVDFYATDNAGRSETSKNVSFSMDTVRPAVLTTSPRGAGANTTPVIVITFSEPMNRASAEAAFTITPDMNGMFQWSTDSRQVTFIPARELEPGTDYFVAIDSSARDRAGNTMQSPTTFSFRTVAAPPSPGSGFDWIWIITVIAAALGGTLFILMRRMGVLARPAPPVAAPEKKTPGMIDDVFLLYHDGILIKHETRRLKPDIDTDILSGMLTAVQSFVKDSFRTEEGELDELTFGEMHILMGRGKWLIVAAIVQGDGALEMRGRIEMCIADMEAHHSELIEKWDGNMTIAKVLSPYIKKLIRGEYVRPPNL